MSKLSTPDFQALTPSVLKQKTLEAIEYANKKLPEIESLDPSNWRGSLSMLREMDQEFSTSWSLLGFLLGVQNTDDMRAVHEELQPKMIELSQRIKQSKAIFLQMKSASTQLDGEEAAVQKIVNNWVRDAKLSGIDLDDEAREKLNALRMELSKANTTFQNNVLDDTKSYQKTIEDKSLLDGVSDSILALYSQTYTGKMEKESTPEEGPWMVTLDYPSLIPLFEQCTNRELRKEVYERHIIKASFGKFDNRDNILKILSLRKQVSKLLGFNNYGELSLATKMADSSKTVLGFLDDLGTKSKNHAKNEYEQIEDFASKTLGMELPLQKWDMYFVIEKYRQEKLSLDSDVIKQYFPLDHVLEQMFDLSQKIFGISIEQDKAVTAWDKDVRFYTLKDSQGKVFAGFYLDPYSRPANKQGGAWMAEITCRNFVDGNKELPIASLSCNFSPPVGGKPSLLQFRQVVTLFHEFGHGTQHMLTRIDHPEVAGINGVEWDAVEIASQFMENFCYEKDFLNTLGKHYDFGKSLPGEMIEKLQGERKFLAGSQMIRQLIFAKTDMLLHTTETDQPMNIYKAVFDEFSPSEYYAKDQFLCAFTHIFAGGYAAGYYSYKWAEVLSCDVYSQFETTANIREVGERYAGTILAKGGSQPANIVFKEFMGREPSVDALLGSVGLG